MLAATLVEERSNHGQLIGILILQLISYLGTIYWEQKAKVSGDLLPIIALNSPFHVTLSKK